MNSRCLLIFFALLTCSFSLQAGVIDNFVGYFKSEMPAEPPSIRVLLVHDVESANLQIQGKYSLFDPYTNSYISSRFAGKSRTIYALGDGLKWGESFPGLYQLQIKPKHASTITAIDGNEYEGLISVYDIGGTISIVNQIPVEDYVRSILMNYQNQDLEPETLAALAIAIRTNSYFQAVNPKNTYWAVDAKKVGFLGKFAGNSSIDRAVNLTRYMIISRTGIYEGAATPFSAQFGNFTGAHLGKEAQVSKISIEEANDMAKKGEHAAQILAKAFPGATMMLMKYGR